MYVSGKLFNQTFEFTFDGSDYIWEGDFAFESSSNGGDYYTPSYGHTKVELLSTRAFVWQDEDGEYRDIIPGDYLIYYLTEIIKQSL